MMRIKEIIKNKNADITDLAKRLNVSRQTVHYYISRGDKNSVDTLTRIASALDISVSDFFEQPKSDVINCPHCGGKIKMSKE
jgi:transcriptional regulator with XRE-family HTH domain